MAAASSYLEAVKKRLPRYRTERPCKYGHLAESYTSTRRCVQCRKLGIIRWENWKGLQEALIGWLRP